MRVASVAGAGPFAITSWNTPTNLVVGRPAVLTWSVAGTGPGSVVNCANVKISLSTDGGTNFSRILTASTPNSGSYSFTVPNAVTTQARFKVESVGNIFFDINNTNLTIAAPSGPPNDYFASAQLLEPPTTFLATGSVHGATPEAGEAALAGIKPTRSVWFRWSAPASGLLLLNITDTAFAHAIGVYTGSQIVSLKLVAGKRFPATGVGASRLEVPVTAGTTYFLKLDGPVSTNSSYRLAGFLRQVPAPAQLRFLITSTTNRPLSPLISWTAVTNANVTHYQVEIWRSNNLLRGITIRTPATNWNNSPPLPRGNGYSARVRAFSTNLASDWTTAPAVFP
jgi:hypothetical protein